MAGALFGVAHACVCKSETEGEGGHYLIVKSFCSFILLPQRQSHMLQMCRRLDVLYSSLEPQMCFFYFLVRTPEEVMAHPRWDKMLPKETKNKQIFVSGIASGLVLFCEFFCFVLFFVLLCFVRFCVLLCFVVLFIFYVVCFVFVLVACSVSVCVFRFVLFCFFPFCDSGSLGALFEIRHEQRWKKVLLHCLFFFCSLLFSK